MGNRIFVGYRIICLLVGLQSVEVFAQTYLGTISRGGGGTGIAAVEPVESMFINPAALPHTENFETGYFYEDGEVTEDKHKTSWGLSLVDNTEKVFIPGGLAYISTRETHKGQRATKGSLLQFSAGNFVHQQFSVGVSLFRKEQREDGGRTFTQFNSVLGVLFNPHADFGIGIVYYNLSGGDREAPEHLRLLPKLGVGINYIMSRFSRVRIDYSLIKELNLEEKPEYSIGVESMLQNYFVFRVGGKWDDRKDERYVTTGLSFNGPRAKLDYAFFKNTKGAKGALHSVNIRIPF